eukprot:6036664-Pyramimonas_sp.AAC.1
MAPGPRRPLSSGGPSPWVACPSRRLFRPLARARETWQTPSKKDCERVRAWSTKTARYSLQD